MKKMQILKNLLKKAKKVHQLLYPEKKKIQT